MSQIVTINAIPYRANLVACQTGSLKDEILDSGEYLAISTLNNLDSNGQGTIDAYIVGNGELTVSQLLPSVKYFNDNYAIESVTTVTGLTPNVYHKWGEIASLTINSFAQVSSETYAEYMIEFRSGNTPTVLTLPNGINWYNDDNPCQNITTNKTYQISIINNLGVYIEF